MIYDFLIYDFDISLAVVRESRILLLFGCYTTELVLGFLNKIIEVGETAKVIIPKYEVTNLL